MSCEARRFNRPVAHPPMYFLGPNILEVQCKLYEVQISCSTSIVCNTSRPNTRLNLLYLPVCSCAQKVLESMMHMRDHWILYFIKVLSFFSSIWLVLEICK